MVRVEWPEPVHAVVRESRRAQGLWQSRDVEVSGEYPTKVVAGLRRALRGQHTPAERRWIRRIEALRKFLLTSPEVFDMTDFGAGPRSSATPPSERTIGHMTRSSKPPRWADLLFQLVRSTGATSLLEMGACVGISAAYQGAALELNDAGRLISLEGVKALQARSARTLEELGLADRAEVRLGEFGATLPGAIDDLAPIDYAFIDGNHQEKATVDYAEQLHPHLADEALLIFDDIDWSDGMARAWQTIVADQRYALTVDLRSVGLAVVSASSTQRTALSIGYH